MPSRGPPSPVSMRGWPHRANLSTYPVRGMGASGVPHHQPGRRCRSSSCAPPGRERYRRPLVPPVRRGSNHLLIRLSSCAGLSIRAGSSPGMSRNSKRCRPIGMGIEYVGRAGSHTQTARSACHAGGRTRSTTTHGSSNWKSSIPIPSPSRIGLDAPSQATSQGAVK